AGVGIELGQRGAGDMPEAQGPHLAVGAQRPFTEGLGELAPGPPAEKVHLPEAVLRGGVALGAHGVERGPGLDVRNAQGVAPYGGGSEETRKLRVAVEPGQGGARPPPVDAGHARRGEQHPRQGEAEQDVSQPVSRTARGMRLEDRRAAPLDQAGALQRRTRLRKLSILAPSWSTFFVSSVTSR